VRRHYRHDANTPAQVTLKQSRGLKGRQQRGAIISPALIPALADPPGAGGNLPQRSVIVGVGPPSTSADFRAGRLAAAEAGATRSRPEVVPFRVYRRTEHLCSFRRSRREHHAIRCACWQDTQWDPWPQPAHHRVGLLVTVGLARADSWRRDGIGAEVSDGADAPFRRRRR
jgi:hypothetical protein